MEWRRLSVGYDGIVIARSASIVVVLAAALAAPPDSPEAYEGFLREARGFVAIGNESRAAAAFRRAFVERPGEAAPLAGLAGVAEREGERDDAVLFLAAAAARAPSEPGVVEALARLDAAPGTGEAATVLAAYLGFAPAAGPGPVGSVAAGEALRLDLLLHVGLDEAGRPVPVEPFFDVSSGLSLEDRPRLAIAARGPSASEWVGVGDARGGAIGRAEIRVIGPPATVALRESRRGAARDESAAAAAPPGDVLRIAASVTDAAGNRLFVPRLEWSAAAEPPAKEDVSGGLAERFSLRPLVHFFEAHRNRFTVPKLSATGDGPLAIVVAATEPVSRATGRFRFTVDSSAAPAVATKSPMPFFAGSWEDALRAARESGKPIFAVVAADW